MPKKRYSPQASYKLFKRSRSTSKPGKNYCLGCKAPWYYRTDLQIIQHRIGTLPFHLKAVGILDVYIILSGLPVVNGKIKLKKSAVESSKSTKIPEVAVTKIPDPRTKKLLSTTSFVPKILSPVTGAFDIYDG